MQTAEEFTWQPDPDALQCHVWDCEDEDNKRPTTILLRHPTTPFISWLDESSMPGEDDLLDESNWLDERLKSWQTRQAPESNLPEKLRACADWYLNEANKYLVQANSAEKCRLPHWWLEALDPALDPKSSLHLMFRWRPIIKRLPKNDRLPPVGSVLVESGRDPNLPNRTLILVASERMPRPKNISKGVKEFIVGGRSSGFKWSYI